MIILGSFDCRSTAIMSEGIEVNLLCLRTLLKKLAS